jgi:alanyl-tRNA synthetase
MAISAKQSDIAEGVDRLLDEQARLKAQISALKRELMAYKLEKLEYTSGSICLFVDMTDMLAARNFVNEAVGKAGRICALFCGDDEQGYKYIIASNTVDLKANMAAINAAVDGRGGGSPRMIQGSCKAKREQIERFFAGESL